MQVEIGPVPAASALAYVELARKRVAEFRSDPGDLAATLTPYTLAMFEDLLTQWEKAALDHDPMTWSIEVDPEVVEHVFYAFYLCVRRVNEEHPDVPREESALRTPFRVALTNGVLSALERQGKSAGELARLLREDWPESDLQ